MKILLTTPTYPPINSGLGNVVFQQASSLAGHGFEVTVATGGQQRGHRVDPISGARIEEFNISGEESWLHPIRGEVDDYVAFLKSTSFDVVVMHAWQNWASDLVLRHASDVSAKKYLFSHCISTNEFYLRQPLRSAIRYLLWRPYWWSLGGKMEKIDGMIFLSAKGEGSRFGDLEIARKKGRLIDIIPNAISLEAAEALQVPTRPVGERPHIISVGSYHWLKGFEFVLRAYAGSTAKNVFPLKIFGQKFTPFTERLRALADGLGLDKSYVSFHENVSGKALLSEYSRARLFLSGSHSECQPLVLLDSMAMGTPFIARSTGCIASLPGGLSVTSENQAAQQIDLLMEDPDFVRELGKMGRTAAQDTYHPDIVFNSLLELLTGEKREER